MPVILYSDDYGYHYWQHHLARTPYLHRLGNGVHARRRRSAFGYSVWLNQTFLGSWVGDPANFESTFYFPGTEGFVSGGQYVLTILQDHMGYGDRKTEEPRSILGYRFVGGSGTEVSIWKVAGNLGGESASLVAFLSC
ncbi:hypothetical protein JVU11DRAFT_2835 [Chiua virens]|nr:hypothetical protein JVU11DRAFT_2835 [Chiua virens]